MPKCVKCEVLAPPSYSKCPECGSNLVLEKFAPQIEEVEEIEPISAFVEMGDISDIGGNL